MGNQHRKNQKRKGGQHGQQQQRKQTPLPATHAQASAPVVIEQSKGDVDKGISTDQNASNSNSIYRLERWQHRFTAALVLFSAVQAGVAYYQWDAMDTQNDIMKKQVAQTDATIEQMRLEQRAWVTFDSQSIYDMHPGKRIDIDFTITNSGHTPAILTGRYAGFGLFLADSDDFGDNVAAMALVNTRDPLEGSVGPGQHVRLPVSSRQVIDEKQIEEISDGTRRLVVVLVLFYRDAMGVDRLTSVCLHYVPEEKQLQTYDQHNHMD